MPLQVKRIYVAPAASDGRRILVDRLWPRGLGKEAAAIDQWLRDCAPSDELRRWFGHDRTRWDTFRQRYFAELAGQDELLVPLRRLAAQERVTLLYAAADDTCNNAVALKEYLEGPAAPALDG